MAKRAILSDVHGNLEALQAVLDDIAGHGVDEIICLGDIVGYGPNPGECLDLAMDFAHCLLGNHDQGVLYDPEGFSSSAERALRWTRAEIRRGDCDQATRRWEFLCLRPRHIHQGPFFFVHGSPRDPLHEYVFPEDVYNAPKIERLFSVVRQYCLMGHTHVPGVFTANRRFHTPEEIGDVYRLGSEKAMINVGSVGQPRDDDCRACYVILEDDEVRFCRVSYPVEKTVEKIYATGELDNFLADRLRVGR
jgi:predicted phosphodiesterase